MADPEFVDAVKALEKFLEEKQSVVTKEKELVEKLDSALQRMGYRIVNIAGAGIVRRQGRPPKNPESPLLVGVRRRGRPPGSKNKRRRPGRPRKTKS